MELLSKPKERAIGYIVTDHYGKYETNNSSRGVRSLIFLPLLSILYAISVIISSFFAGTVRLLPEFAVLLPG